MRSKTLYFILTDGTPYGVKIAELSNWNGRAVVAPRSALKKIAELPEAAMPAVYFLLGEDRRVYVGETDELGKRLARHGAEKPNWHELIAFVSPRITKTEVKYLEHAFIARLAKDGVVQLENGNVPKSPTISASDRDVMDEFVDRASDVLLSLGYDILSVNDEVEARAKDTGMEVECIGPEAHARGLFSEHGLLVKQGSLTRKQPAPAFEGHNYLKLRNQLVESGILQEINGVQYLFTQDHLFSSPSAAAAIVLARSANGWTEWITKEGNTLKDGEER